ASSTALLVDKMQKNADQVAKDVLRAEDLLKVDRNEHQFQHQNEIKDKLGNAEGLLKDLFLDIDNLKKLKNPQATAIESEELAAYKSQLSVSSAGSKETSKLRNQYLSSLYKYMQGCNKELNFLAEEQDKIKKQDWSDHMVDLPDVRWQYEAWHVENNSLYFLNQHFKNNSLLSHESEVNRLQDEAERLIELRHPASDTIQEFASRSHLLTQMPLVKLTFSSAPPNPKVATLSQQLDQLDTDLANTEQSMLSQLRTPVSRSDPAGDLAKKLKAQEKQAAQADLQPLLSKDPSVTSSGLPLKLSAASNKYDSLAALADLYSKHSLQQSYQQYCPDIQRQRKDVKQLQVRYDNVTNQLKERENVLQEASAKHKYFQSTCQSLNSFLDNLPTRQINSKDDLSQVTAKQSSQK
ncbi:hypothetical protein XENOCAPTIV_022643, partial [Xenoophorus captivus]